MALMKVMQMLGSGRLDHRTAGLMLYALQTASCNLRNLSFEPSESTDVVIDRDDIHRTYIGGQQWFEKISTMTPRTKKRTKLSAKRMKENSRTKNKTTKR